MQKTKSNHYYFSIITVVLNGEKFLEKCIKSVLAQSYKNFELIIIDGGSTDKTTKIIKKYNKKISYWESKKDGGIYDAMNKGIRKSKGNIIGILNSDDLYKKNALKIIKNYFDKKKNMDFIFGSVKKNRVMAGFHPQKIKWKFNVYPGHSSGFFVKKSVHSKIGLYNTKFKYSADYDFIYKMLVKYNIRGMCTKKNEITGIFGMTGISSKVGIFGKLNEEKKVRLHNKQNFIYVYILFFLHLINFIYYKFKSN